MTQLTTASNTPEDRILFRADICKALGVCPDTLRRWIRAGKLPEPDIALSRKTQGWRLSTLHAAGVKLL